MHRFFITPEQVDGHAIRLSPEQAHQVTRVLRLRAGQSICVLDGAGRECAALLTEVSPAHVIARAGAWQACEREPHVHLCLALGLLKGEKMDWAVQKATEVGATVIVPLCCARSVVRLREGRADGKTDRWQKIAREAAEQCRRGRVPRVTEPRSLPALLQRAAEFELLLLADEGEAAPLANALREREHPNALLTSAAREANRLRVLLLIGPEGGFDTEEARLAREAGAVPVSFGPRILRAETAAVVGAALVLHELEDRNR